MSLLSPLSSLHRELRYLELHNYSQGPGQVASLHLIIMFWIRNILFTVTTPNNSDLSFKHFIFHSFQVAQVGEVLRALGTNPTEGEVKKLITSTCTVSVSTGAQLADRFSISLITRW